MILHVFNRSKREIHTFLTVDCSVYLPQVEQVSIYFLRDLVSGNKKSKCTGSAFVSDPALYIGVKNKEVRHITVPQYEGLALKDIAQVLNEFHPEVYEYLPDSMEIHKVNKDWICNVCASVIGDGFQAWVKRQVEARNQMYIDQKNTSIAMDEEIAAVYRASTKVSCKC